MKSIADLRNHIKDNFVSFSPVDKIYSSSIKEVKSSSLSKSRVVDAITTFFMRSSKGEERRIKLIGNEWKTIQLQLQL